MKYNLLILVFLLLGATAEAQNKKYYKGYRIEINAPQNQGETAYLAKYWDGALYTTDSLVLSNKGQAVLESDIPLEQGQYLLYIKPNVQLELLIGNYEQNIKLDVNAADINACKVVGSNDTKLLWQYLSYVEKVNKEAEAQNNELNQESIAPKRKKELEDKMNANVKTVDAYIKKLADKHKEEWFGIFLKGMQPIILPYPHPTARQEEDKNREYGKAHFFDNINLADPRFWNTNFFTEQIDNYMDNYVEQIPDSLAAAADRLVAKTQGNKTCFKNMLSRFVNTSMKSNVMGRENIWAELAENYIFERNVNWIDSTQLSQLKSEYEKIKHNRIGIKAHNLQLVEVNGEVINTNSIDSEYLLIYFYSPTCGHCQKEVPALHNETYQKYKDILKIVAIDINNERPMWKKFIDDNKLYDWMNCNDAEYKTQYWMYYNTASIPAMFLLDKNKKIIARNLDKSNLEKFLEIYIDSKK